jgi:hypothetical protein
MVENDSSLKELAEDALAKVSAFYKECTTLPSSLTQDALDTLQQQNEEANYAVALSYSSLFETIYDENGRYKSTEPREEFDRSVYVILSRAQDLYWDALHTKYNHRYFKQMRM